MPLTTKDLEQIGGIVAKLIEASETRMRQFVEETADVNRRVIVCQECSAIVRH